MTMHSDRLLLDTNVLQYAMRETSPFHRAARQSLTEARIAGAELWVSRQVLRELCVALLIPQLGLPGVTPELAAWAMDDCAARYFVADEDARVSAELHRLVRTRNLPWRVIHDAIIVATMLVNGIPRILTHNTVDFELFSDLIEIVRLPATN